MLRRAILTYKVDRTGAETHIPTVEITNWVTTFEMACNKPINQNQHNKKFMFYFSPLGWYLCKANIWRKPQAKYGKIRFERVRGFID